MKQNLKEKAIFLRRKGESYNRILKQIPVAKSTLSLWLRSVKLTRRQKQKLTKRKMDSIRRGWKIWSQHRLDKIEKIRKSALQEISTIRITKNNLWLMGIMLYWAEGSKEKGNKKGSPVIFSNSDAFMIRLYLKWLYECLNISSDNIIIQLYVHENHTYRLEDIIDYWSKITGISREKFGKIYYKKHNIRTIRKNTQESYHGLLRIVVRSSTDLNRRIAGWTQGICIRCGIV